jgi:imidazole glycerol-phosphate synthase subunit HisF
MIYPRLIPCLLLDKNGDMVKTINFIRESRRYIGDIENAVKIFNEKQADEIIVLDIDASSERLEPKFDIIKKIALSCRMPISYGGGIKNLDQAKKIISLGVEKVVLSSVIFENINLVKEISEFYGSQSVAVCIDILFINNEIKLFSHNGNKYHSDHNILDLIKKIQEKGVGELIINSIDRDGTMSGYNLEYIDNIYKNILVPLTLLGGAGEVDHFKDVIKKIAVSGLAAGSFFIYKSKKKGVLINYPNKKTIF